MVGQAGGYVVTTVQTGNPPVSVNHSMPTTTSQVVPHSVPPAVIRTTTTHVQHTRWVT